MAASEPTRPLAGDAVEDQDGATRHAAAIVIETVTTPKVLRRLAIALILTIATLKVVEWFFFGTRHFLFLLLLAWLFAIGMEPAVGWLARHNVRRGYGTALVMLGLLLAVTLFFAAFGSLLIEQVVNLAEALPDTVTKTIDWVNQTFSTNIDPNSLTSGLQLSSSNVADWTQRVGLGIFGFVTSLVGIVFDFFIVLLFAFYFSADGPRLRRFLASWLPPEPQRVVNNVWEVAIRKTGGYVASRLILAIIAAAFTSVFLLILDIPYWLPLGIWTGVVSQFIPTLGTYLGGALPALFAFTVSVTDGIAVIIFVLVYQQVENYFLAPRISNKTMAIHPAVAFGSVLVGGSLGGALGALIAIPIAASIQSLIETYGRRYELIPELAHDESHPWRERSEVGHKHRPKSKVAADASPTPDAEAESSTEEQ